MTQQYLVSALGWDVIVKAASYPTAINRGMRSIYTEKQARQLAKADGRVTVTARPISDEKAEELRAAWRGKREGQVDAL